LQPDRLLAPGLSAANSESRDVVTSSIINEAIDDLGLTVSDDAIAVIKA
jgi:molybdopterin-binding protein